MNIVNDVRDEKDLLSQIDEFRKKAENLQLAMQSRESKAKELEALVSRKQETADELDQLIAQREAQSNVFKKTIQQEMDGVSNRFEDSLNEIEKRVDSTLKSSEERQTEALAGITTSLSDIAERLERIETTADALPETVHKEGVQVYRNTYELIKNLSERVDTLDKVDAHVGKARGAAIAATVFSILSVAGIAFVALLSLGMISF